MRPVSCATFCSVQLSAPAFLFLAWHAWWCCRWASCFCSTHGARVPSSEGRCWLRRREGLLLRRRRSSIPANWIGLLKATPVQSEVASTSGEVAWQIARNLVTGFQVFLVSNHNTHFVVGPHVDPITAVLMVAGLAALLVALRQRLAAAMLLSSVAFWAAVTAIQQYGYPVNTRMFILVPFYALYAGIGGAAIGAVIHHRARLRTVCWGLALLVSWWQINSIWPLLLSRVLRLHLKHSWCNNCWRPRPRREHPSSILWKATVSRIASPATLATCWMGMGLPPLTSLS